MEYEIYIDVLFLVDFACSFLALSLTAQLLGSRFPALRAAAAAAFGSLWTCIITVFPVLPIFWELAVTVLLVGSMMTVLTFSVKDLRSILKADGLLLTSCIAMGGAMMTLKQFLYLKDWEALFCLGAVFCAVHTLMRMWTFEKARGQERYQVKLYYRGENKMFSALCDSGNRLKEPVSGKAVSVIAYEDCMGFCDKVEFPLYIPYRAVGTETGLLTGMILEKMEIRKGTEWLEIRKPVVAVSKEPLSVSGDFNMLLPEELLLSAPVKKGNGTIFKTNEKGGFI